MILVTGGTGLVGSHLLLRLVQEGVKVRAIYRNASKIDAVKKIFGYYTTTPDVFFNAIEWVEADITVIPDLDAAFKGINYVYHCAGYISFDPNEFKNLKKINIEGTANVVNLCISHNVKKMCYVSSIAALGVTTNAPVTEDTHWNPEAKNSGYAISKYGGEMEVWRASREGLDVVIVNPGVILGIGFWNTGSGRLFSEIYKGRTYYVTGSTGYVALTDVTNAMLLLMASSVKNERYILVSENLSFKTVAEDISKRLNIAPPKIEAKPWLLEIGWRLDWLKHFLFRTPRVLSKALANSVFDKVVYNNDKIKAVKLFQFTPIAKTLDGICAVFLKEN